MADKDILEDAREAFKRAEEAEDHNRTRGLEDLKFARLGGEEQWPEGVKKLRGTDRPMLTINKQNAFIRQVVNDSRQNKPSIAVHPVDSGADKKTADVYSGLIRNIEYTSSADIAYDTAVEHAVSGGRGYIGVDIDYAHDDTFEMDIKITRKSNPFAIYGDPDDKSADGSEANSSFEVDMIRKEVFEDQYKGAKKVDWESESYSSLKGSAWVDDEYVMIAKWWQREETNRQICLLSDGTVIDKEKLGKSYYLLEGVTVVQEREAKGFKVTCRLMTGAEVLETVNWKGKYIPLIPVYGDEVDIEGKRYWKSLIHDAKDAQRNYNYWRTTATELIALAPRVPFIGPKGSFNSDPNWFTANSVNHPFLEYDVVQGGLAPARQPLDTGAAAGAISEALAASDDMKAVLGIYDASLGARSNETSGRAIMARQREGDVSTFHFIDNLRRSIRQVGRVVIDLIPPIYTEKRIVRVLGEDGTAEQVPLGKPLPVMGEDGQPQMQPAKDPMTGQPQMQMTPQGPQPVMIPMTRIVDLGVGKYDLTVSSGPSFTTRREEAATQMTEMIRAMPDTAPLIMDLVAQNLDWPGADKIAERFKAMVPDKAKGGLPPELQKQMQEAEEKFKELEGKLQQTASENQMLKIKLQQAQDNSQIDAMRLKIEEFKAQTDRIEAMVSAMRPPPQPRPMNGPTNRP